jgi:hypothetical protein
VEGREPSTSQVGARTSRRSGAQPLALARRGTRRARSPGREVPADPVVRSPRMAQKRKKPADESLTPALARLLDKTILPDLEARAKTPAVAAILAEQHAREKAASRTADTLAEWTPRWLEQIGAAWVLSCVFLRTLEDRGLVRHRRIAGEGAADAEHLFFEIAPSLTARDYLLTAFCEVARHPGAEELLGPAGNPAFRLSPSNEGVPVSDSLRARAPNAGVRRSLERAPGAAYPSRSPWRLLPPLFRWLPFAAAA